MKSKLSTTKADPDLAQWCAALAQLTTPVDVVPPGWLTAQGLADKIEIPKATLQQRLNRLVASGQAERKMFRVRLAKNTRPVPHYRLK
jgi:DNA-binding IclR family transcriptional regulator